MCFKSKRSVEDYPLPARRVPYYESRPSAAELKEQYKAEKRREKKVKVEEKKARRKWDEKTKKRERQEKEKRTKEEKKRKKKRNGELAEILSAG